MSGEVAKMREEYRGVRLLEEEAGTDPLALFARWLADAMAAELHEPNAMTLATASADGRPSARMVLLKGFDGRGFCFYTNYESRKGQELAENPWAALVFWWGPLARQVRVEGRVEKLTAEESDAYFRTRPLGSRLSAWASPQSRVIPDRATLEAWLREVEERFAGQEPPRPPYWGGYRVIPQSIEFWQGGPDRLHDRLRYTREGDTWRLERLAP
uniref:Pyridoxamine 5'-phosphate oxidase n=2 Tax=Litorilinea aerophila TaxID=1204385 RepID=A0A540VM88_9CHLR